MTTKSNRAIAMRITLWTVVVIMALEVLSMVAHVYPIAHDVGLIVIGVLVFGATIYRPWWGMSVAAAELLIGSKGHLLVIDIFSIDMSLRLVIFLMVIAGWLVALGLRRVRLGIPRLICIAYGALVVVIALAALHGWLLRGYPLQRVFLDTNGYLYLGLFLPALSAFARREDLYRSGFILLGAWISSVLKTWAMLYIFSHNIESIALWVYRWVRVTGVGEITNLGEGTYRIFFQSHIYSALLMVMLLFLSVHASRVWSRRRFVLLTTLLALCCSVVILLSGSRSMFFALAITMALGGLYLLMQRQVSWRSVQRTGVLLLCAACAGYLMTAAIVAFPYPAPGAGGAGSVFSQRADTGGDAATSSRMALLRPLSEEVRRHVIVGKGLGTTVTYHTHDPRALELNGTDLYTTYAFEWGWLDLLLKFGIVGTLVYVWFLWVALTGDARLKTFRTFHENPLTFGAVMSIVFLGMVHLLTPYLNHPLGIGAVIMLAVYLQVMRAHVD